MADDDNYGGLTVFMIAVMIIVGLAVVAVAVSMCFKQ